MTDPRPIGPTGVPCVGDAPLTVFAIARAIEGAGLLPEKIDAARRAHPTLTEDDARAAIELAEREPASLAPRPGLALLATLALPLGVGSIAFAVGSGLLATVVLGVVGLLALRAHGESAPGFPTALALRALCGALFLVVGVGLARLSKWARGLLVVVAVGGIVAAQTTSPVNFGALACGALAVLGVLLFLPAMNRWFTLEGRVSASALSCRPYHAAVAWMSLLGFSFGVTGAFKRLFQETGVALPATTQMLLVISDFLTDFAFALAPLTVLAVIFGFSPLLRVDVERRRGVFWAVNVAGFVAFVVVVWALVLPVVQLMQRL
ncbi:MAG TPA: hypothetical protein VFF73_32350 [Planctomycetota bacterium]|nr:hypothetical protein [Planctomycetota bacterium]